MNDERYRVKLDSNIRFSSPKITEKHSIGTVASAIDLRLAAVSTRPRYCQYFVVDMIEYLEKQGLVAQGTAAYWKTKTDPQRFCSETEALYRPLEYEWLDLALETPGVRREHSELDWLDLQAGCHHYAAV